MNTKKPSHSFARHIKKLTWKTYFGSATIFLILSLLMSAFFISAINEYLNEIFIDQAINLAKSYTHTFDLSNTANETINELLEERLNVALNGFENHLPKLLLENDEIYQYKERFKVDEIYIFNPEGKIVASGNTEFLNWTLPNEHPVTEFKISNNIIQYDAIRKATESDTYFKFAYLKTSNDYIIQVGISAESIQNISKDFSPKTLLDTIENENILLADIYLNDKTNFLFEEHHDIAIFDSFEMESLKSNEVQYRFTHQLEDESLQIFVPLHIENHRIGTLILFHSTDYHRQVLGNTMFLIVFMMVSIFLIIAYLLWSHYIKSRNLENVSYIDETSGIYNRAYFLEYIKEHLNQIRDERHHFSIVVLSNYTQLKLLHNEAVFDTIIKAYSEKVLSKSPHKERAFQYFDDVILLYYTKHNENYNFEKEIESFLEDLKSVNTYGSALEVKVGLLEIDQRYSTSHEINSNISASIKELREPQTPSIYTFTSAIWDQLIYSERLLNDLRRAYLNHFDDEFYVVFQPQIDRALNRVVCFESLSRWKHPKLGMIAPDTFIEVAENSNLIIPIGDRVIEKSLRFINTLIKHGYDDIKVSINVSYAQLKQPHFVEKLDILMNQMNIPFHLVGLEVTESMFIDDYEAVNDTLNSLMALGIHIYLDDFGMGYSSIDRVNNLSINTIKIDKSFVDMIETKQSIIEGVLSLTNKLNYSVVAEGVESHSQIEWLEKHGCTIFQGYYYAQGMTQDKAIQYLKENYHPDK